MDPELAALASTAATTIVGLLATEGWEQARRAVGTLWQRVHPERSEAVQAELIEARTELVTARQEGDEEAEHELVAEWRRRLSRLLQAGDEQFAEEFRRTVDELLAQSPTGTEADGAGIQQRATASGHGRIYQAGRDQHITER